jgi:hypothetical protein
LLPQKRDYICIGMLLFYEWKYMYICIAMICLYSMTPVLNDMQSLIYGGIFWGNILPYILIKDNHIGGVIIPPLIERGLYCNHFVRPSVCPSVRLSIRPLVRLSVCPSVHTFVTDISASTGRNDCTSISCLPCDLQMNEWGYS